MTLPSRAGGRAASHGGHAPGRSIRSCLASPLASHASRLMLALWPSQGDDSASLVGPPMIQPFPAPGGGFVLVRHVSSVSNPGATGSEQTTATFEECWTGKGWHAAVSQGIRFVSWRDALEYQDENRGRLEA